MISDEIEAYYRLGAEEKRLEQGYFPLERARTETILQRALPPPPATVLDVGGGAGAYAFWLADRGYHVHLIDPVSLHVKQAERAAGVRAQPSRACALATLARSSGPMAASTRSSCSGRLSPDGAR